MMSFDEIWLYCTMTDFKTGWDKEKAQNESKKGPRKAIQLKLLCFHYLEAIIKTF